MLYTGHHCLQKYEEGDTVYVKSVASSPDTESYEFLNGQSQESGELQDLPPDEHGEGQVESIGSLTEEKESPCKPDSKGLATDDEHHLSAESDHTERVHSDSAVNEAGDYDDDFEEYEEGDTDEEEIEEDIILEDAPVDTSHDSLHADLRKRLPRETTNDSDQD